MGLLNKNGIENEFAGFFRDGLVLRGASQIEKLAGELAKSNPPLAAEYYSRLGFVYKSLYRNSDADVSFQRAVACLQDDAKKFSLELAVARYELAVSKEAHGIFEDVPMLYKQSFSVLRNESERGRALTAKQMRVFSGLYFRADKRSMGKHFAESALAAARIQEVRGVSDIEECLLNLTRFESDRLKVEKLLREAVEVAKSSRKPHDIILWDCHRKLANFYQDRDEYDKAYACWQSAFKSYSLSQSPRSFPLAVLKFSLARCAVRMQKYEQALRSYLEAISVLNEYYPANDRIYLTQKREFVVVYRKLGRVKESEKLEDEIHRKLRNLPSYAGFPRVILE